MKRLILSAGTILLAATSLLGQVGSRSVSRSLSIEAYRPVGEVRVWTFVSRDSAVGQLSSTVLERTTIDGRPALKIAEKLSFDYRKIGSELTIGTEGVHLVSSDGVYLGDDLTVSIADKTENLTVRRVGDSVVATFTRGGEEIRQAQAFRRNGFGWDNNYLDQLEMLLAMRDLTVGDVIIDTVFAPQPMVTSPVYARVEEFRNIRLYNNRSDSCFVIRLTEPEQWVLYFAPNKRLVKVEMPGQSTKVYLDVVQKGMKQAASVAKPFDWVRLIRMIPSFLAYLIITALALVFYVKRGYRWLNAYFALLAGGVLFWAVPFSQTPLQTWTITHWLIPQVTAGGSLYAWGLLPGLVAGVVQAGLLLLALWLVVRLRRPGESQIALLGAFCGAGLGLLEACYQGYATNASTVFSFQLLERGALILFHVTAGLVIGDALTWNDRRLVGALGLAVVINALLRYLPVFVQQRAVQVEVMYFVIAIICLLIVAAALLYRRRSEQSF